MINSRLKVTIILFLFFVFTSSIVLGSINEPKAENRNEKPIVLITGFEPFANFDINPSMMIAERLNGTSIADSDIIGIVVSVNFTTSIEIISEAIEKYHPDIVMCLGLNGNTRCIRIEKIALNLKKSRDESGVFYEKLESNGSMFRFSNLPTYKIASKIRQEKIPAIVNYHAGTYVCNAAFYGVLGHIKQNNLDIDMGFIHIPQIQGLGVKSMKFEDMMTAIKIAVEVSVNS